MRAKLEVKECLKKRTMGYGIMIEKDGINIEKCMGKKNAEQNLMYIVYTYVNNVG